ncbi:formimidoylglutamase [Brevibacillus formosus]|uniref:formimidoylglutamase n=1 Tax=Brevibacillus TaxID=55080 RepID=UPI000D103710|nr:MULTISPECIES: formimidoylglutamase [Brevibacillus]MBG9944744.1 formimidoylglutamase [Brevibacillus formosus]MED1947244.1 formimidoylglutamase [Brevibacillus formosus]MED1997489.1 formimidoylglutamase [Brevibacillus formosus]MED2083346.1 formimidoylglutamase [Brevibacillus formosus]PSK16834.1 formimidoylglutamase [Brevibacillus sp. NRRL NRS-603]
MNSLPKNVSADLWTGRTDHTERRSSFRYHQIVEITDLDTLQAAKDRTVAIIGFECEEGVRRNQGRLGAAKAPNAIRQALASLPWKVEEGKRLVDVGNVACPNEELEAAQEELGNAVSAIFSKSMTPIILGGGHETLYGHYIGVRKHIGKEASLGIINIDAHFDLRSYEVQPSSGTMFRQILEHDKNSSYFVLGIQRFGNTQELFDKADELGVRYVYEEEMTDARMDEIGLSVSEFIEKHDHVMLTLCTDVLNAAFAPGVSAPSPFGLTPMVVRTLIRTVAAHKKTLSFDICEVNPVLDENGRTVKLGAYLTNEAIMGLLEN